MVILGSISSNTIESAGIWLDHAEGLPLSQLFREYGLVSFESILHLYDNWLYHVKIFVD